MCQYGISDINNKLFSYRAKVPLISQGKYRSKDFSEQKYDDPLKSALQWRDKIGCEVWGREIWDMILKTRSVRCFWGKVGGVSSCCHTIDEEDVWVVFWKEKGKPQIKIFRESEQENADCHAEKFTKNKSSELAFKRAGLGELVKNRSYNSSLILR